MRQRRQRLQVSTFPFLAVLLCAMGSLILLLLVMDRRAKVVARAKAMRAMDQALAQATAEDERAAAAHRAEWERRRQLLHEQLQQQDEQVLQELQGVQQQLTTAAASVQTELARSHDLREQLQTERSTLARAEEDLTARRAEVARAAQQTEGSRTELARLTADLERMEHCMAELQAARQRQQQMVSLVPYRGKRGDNRKPLYIECNGDELIFHPDRLALHGATLGPSAIRDEIDRRLAQQHSETKAVNAKSEASAYLLMLIRPNGIQTYYQTLAALKGLRLDFGYEFLDQDWILDFSEDDGKPKQQPWMTAERTQERQPSSPSAKKVEGAGPAHSARPEKPYQGLASGGSGSGRPMGTFTSGSAGSGHSVVQGAGMDASGQGLFAGATAGNPANVPRATAQGNGGRAALDTGEGRPPSLAEFLAAGSRSSAARATSLDGNAFPASQHSLGQGELVSAPGGATEGSATNQAVIEGRPGTKAQPADSRGVQGNGTAEPAMAGGAPGAGKPDLDAPPSLLPPAALHHSKATGDASADAEPASANERGVRMRPADGGSGSGERAPGPGGDPLDRLKAQNATQKSVRTVAVRPGPLVGNRDWNIVLECKVDALVLLPSGQRIATGELSRGDKRTNPLLETIQRMIARRQATVRPGEPPYRPRIRFRVWPDGLRSYHLAYPALEALHVPMTRENVDPEEAKPATP